jgi:hypothetical protein
MASLRTLSDWCDAATAASNPPQTSVALLGKYLYRLLRPIPAAEATSSIDTAS